MEIVHSSFFFKLRAQSLLINHVSIVKSRPIYILFIMLGMLGDPQKQHQTHCCSWLVEYATGAELTGPPSTLEKKELGGGNWVKTGLKFTLFLFKFVVSFYVEYGMVTVMDMMKFLHGMVVWFILCKSDVHWLYKTSTYQCWLIRGRCVKNVFNIVSSRYNLYQTTSSSCKPTMQNLSLSYPIYYIRLDSPTSGNIDVLPLYCRLFWQETCVTMNDPSFVLVRLNL